MTTLCTLDLTLVDTFRGAFRGPPGDYERHVAMDPIGWLQHRKALYPAKATIFLKLRSEFIPSQRPTVWTCMQHHLRHSLILVRPQKSHNASDVMYRQLSVARPASENQSRTPSLRAPQ